MPLAAPEGRPLAAVGGHAVDALRAVACIRIRCRVLDAKIQGPESPCPTAFSQAVWQRDPSLVLFHLLRKHEGDLVELEGRWEEGQGEDLDALFDPQFACSEEDFKFCKGYGKSGDSYERGKHAAAYRVVNRMTEEANGGRTRARSSQPFGGTGQPAVWRQRPVGSGKVLVVTPIELPVFEGR